MRTDTTVRDVMHREFLGVSESDSLSEAAALLVEEETNCVVVVRGSDPVGRLESRDALDVLLDADRSASDADDELTVANAMGPPLPAVSPNDSLTAVEERLVAEGADRVVAVDDGEAVGVVTDGDVLAAGAPRAGTGAGGFGDETAADSRPKEAVLSAAAADSDAERTDAATMNPDAASDREPAGSPEGSVAGDGDDGGPAAGAPSASSTQGVCESCGALVPDLVTANGQAVCPNCREI
jgi:predicted transcriptional regulator